MTTAHALHDRVAEQLDQLHRTRRAVLELVGDYTHLDATTVAVDDLGDPLDPADALHAARVALADVQRALGLAEDALHVAQRTTSRLYTP